MLNKDDVLHIARLAHLDLSDTEVEKFSAQLSDVLELFSKIDGLDLKDEAETSQITGLENVFRADEIKKYPSLTDTKTSELVESAPIHSGNEIKVPKVIEEN